MEIAIPALVVLIALVITFPKIFIVIGIILVVLAVLGSLGGGNGPHDMGWN